MVGDVYQYTYWRIRVYLPVHLAAFASKYSNSNSCGVDCTDRHVCSLGIEALWALDSPHTASEGGHRFFLVHGADTLDSCYLIYSYEILTNIEMC